MEDKRIHHRLHRRIADAGHATLIVKEVQQGTPLYEVDWAGLAENTE